MDSTKSSGCKEGYLAWFVLSYAFTGQALSAGFYYSFGPIYIEILTTYGCSESVAAWIGSFGYSSCAFLGIVTSLLCRRFGCGYTMSLGGGFLGLGAILSSFASSVWMLFLTYGILVSIGTSCLYFSSLLVLPLYFRKRLGLANGIASSGASVSGVFLPPFFAYIIERFDLKTMFQVYAVFAIVPLTAGFFIRRKLEHEKKTDKRSLCEAFIDRSLLQNKAYVLFVVAFSLIYFAYYVPYVHLVNYSTVKGVLLDRASTLPSIISAASAVGKFAFGYAATVRHVNKIYMFQGFLLLMSVSLTLLPLASKYTHFSCVAAIFGIGDGGFCSYIIVLCNELLRTDQLASGFGIMYAVAAFFALLGPPFAAFIVTASDSYELAFSVSGALLTVGALSLFVIPFLVPSEGHYDSIEAIAVTSNESIKVIEKFSPTDLEYNNNLELPLTCSSIKDETLRLQTVQSSRCFIAYKDLFENQTAQSVILNPIIRGLPPYIGQDNIELFIPSSEYVNV